MKRAILIAATSLLCCTTRATFLTDSFDRANTRESSDFSESIGPDWINANGGDSSARIFNKQVNVVKTSGAAPMKFLMINTAAINERRAFTVKSTLQQNTMAGSAAAGVVFNYQDADNYGIFRYFANGMVQIGRMLNGKIGTFKIWQAAFVHMQNQPYQIQISTTDSRTFDLEFKNTVTGEVIIKETVSAPADGFHDGLAGVAGSTGFVSVDAFSFQTP